MCARDKEEGGEACVQLNWTYTKHMASVEWTFLKAMMVKHGFDNRWIHLMIECVSTVRYHLRFNTFETNQFILSRGLRQGDPLSLTYSHLC